MTSLKYTLRRIGCFEDSDCLTGAEAGLMARMVATAFTLRAALVPFNRYLFENLMDAAHIHAWEQGNVARALVAGHGFGSPFVSGQASAIMPPVYTFIVAVFFRLFGVHTPAAIGAIHLFDCAVNSLAVIPLWLVARDLWGDRIARHAGWAWVVFPYGIYFGAAWAWPTHLLLNGLLWMLWFAPRLEKASGFAPWAWFGLLAGLVGLTEPSGLPAAGLLLVAAVLGLRRRNRPWLGRGATAALCLAAALSPWLIRNAVIFHRLIPVRDSFGLELWMGNNGYDLRWTTDDRHPLHDAAELAEYNSSGEQRYLDHKLGQAKAYIRDHPGWFLRMCARRAVYLWTGYWSFDPRYLDMEPSDPANIPFATALTLSGLAGLFCLYRREPAAAIRFAGVLLLFPLPYYVTHPEPYHMRVLDPLMVVLACGAIALLRRPRGSRVPETAIAAA